MKRIQISIQRENFHLSLSSFSTMDQIDSCLFDANTCYFINPNNRCLSDEDVLKLIVNYVFPTYYEWLCIILYALVFIIGTIGNLLVILVIQRNRSMR